MNTQKEQEQQEQDRKDLQCQVLKLMRIDKSRSDEMWKDAQAVADCFGEGGQAARLIAERIRDYWGDERTKEYNILSRETFLNWCDSHTPSLPKQEIIKAEVLFNKILFIPANPSDWGMMIDKLRRGAKDARLGERFKKAMAAIGDLAKPVFALWKNGEISLEQAVEQAEKLAADTAVVASKLEGKTYKADGIGNAELFADTYRDDVRYISEWKKWLKWDGKCWVKMNSEGIQLMGQNLVRNVMTEVAKRIENEADRNKYFKHLASSTAIFQVNAMIEGARGRMVIDAEDLDSDTNLVNYQNGTMDCKTGNLRPYDRKDLLTKMTPCNYDEAATCPIFLKFLNRILPPNLIIFIQTAVGYSLTGSIKQQCVFVLHGSGANGKSTLIDIILHCMGDYGQTMQPSVLLLNKYSNGGNGEDVASLCGVRFASAKETGEGGRLNVEKLKAMTGDKRISARFLYQNSFEFDVTHKVWLATNHMPKIDGNDFATLRRIRRVPFLATISDQEKDEHLGEKLLAERDGIMAWAIVGLKRWLVEGLISPNEVTEATAKYGEDNDEFGLFLGEVCIKDASAEIKSGELFYAYKHWAEDNGIDHTMTAMSMAKKLKERDYCDHRKGSGKFWRGLKLISTSKHVIDKSEDEDTGDTGAETKSLNFDEMFK